MLISFYKAPVIWPSPPIRQGQSYYVCQYIKGRHTTSLNVCVPRFFFYHTTRCGKKTKRGGTHGPPFFPFAVVALTREARKFKVIFLNIAFKQKNTYNPWYGPPHFMGFKGF